ncbi:MAG TPA: 16S rRNA (cytidine(1402)-2'-O)-methyltransferase [Bacteroidota bacterium]|nr:16S rRNA (cytidine(1402)-2'-O)-methyltransferase [Bacteroidota bacterium]
MPGTLYLVATPIGNFADMTFRALDVLKEADLVVCEERPEGERLLKHFNLERPLETLNEHNEAAATHTILGHLKGGRTVALVSDCGTPVFSDPGRLLVERAVESGVRVVPVPGASSLMPALTASGFAIDQFLFYGWLSPKKDRRLAELRELQRDRRTIVLMDTPYRLVPLLRDIAAVFGASRRMVIAFNLTLPDEQILRGVPPALHAACAARELKGEYVIVIEGRARERKE